MFDLVVVPVIVNGWGLSPEEKILFFKMIVFFIAGSGWLMFFHFVFSRVFYLIKNKIKRKGDKK